MTVRIKKEIIVIKFGGTSVGSIEKIKNVANIVAGLKNTGKAVVVVVSAMGHTTDELIDLALGITKNPDRREMDMLLSTGEQVSVSLLAIALHSKGYKSVSMTGIQAGILTDGIYSNAKILSVNTTRVLKEIAEDRIVIVAGFQGFTSEGDITTLGRGGSDTTAVALAASLKAGHCEIYTDVDGVFTTDPNVVPEARKIDSLSYDEMLELASSGAKVLHLRAVEYAKKNDVILHVKSSFNNKEGTWVMDFSRKGEDMERPVVTGVTYDTNQVKVTIFGLADKPGIAAKLFSAFSSNNVNVDLIVQNVSEKDVATISFTVKNEDLEGAKEVLNGLRKEIDYKEIDIDEEVGKVSIVGAGMQTHSGVAAKMFSILSDEGINIEMISTSPIRISCVIRREKIKLAVRSLHEGFDLDRDMTL